MRDGGGEGEARYGATTTAALATATERDSAMGQIYGSVPARRSFGAATATLNVFNSLSTGVNACVLSNGVLLERQKRIIIIIIIVVNVHVEDLVCMVNLK